MPSPGPGSAGRKKVTENGVKRKKKNRRAKQDERWTGERERAAALADRQLRRLHSFPSPDYPFSSLSSFSLNAELTYAKLFAISPSIK